MKKTYDVKIQDFTPGIGFLFYKVRNRKNNETSKLRCYVEYRLVGEMIAIVDLTTAIGIYKGLETLLK